MTGQQKRSYPATWRGMTLDITYEPQWSSVTALDVAHLEIRSVHPHRAALPITETGYKSHFCGRQRIEDMGGPVAYVLAWLEAEAGTERWRRAEADARQLSLSRKIGAARRAALRLHGQHRPSKLTGRYRMTYYLRTHRTE